MSGAEGRLVLAAIDGPVATITLNRPERHNSLVPAMLRELLAAIETCDSAPEARVLVLRAAGHSFSTGGDLLGFRQHEDAIADYAAELVGLLNNAVIRLVDGRLPVIAVVDGQVTGGALGLVLASDVVLVTDRASFTPYYVEAGFCPDGGWSAILPDVIGRTRASTRQLLNQSITSAQALDWGLATAHAETARLDEAVAELCGQLLDKKTGSVRCTRRLLRPRDLEARLEEERQRFTAQIGTAEARAAIRAWLGDE